MSLFQTKCTCKLQCLVVKKELNFLIQAFKLVITINTEIFLKLLVVYLRKISWKHFYITSWWGHFTRRKLFQRRIVLNIYLFLNPVAFFPSFFLNLSSLPQTSKGKRSLNVSKQKRRVIIHKVDPQKQNLWQKHNKIKWMEWDC